MDSGRPTIIASLLIWMTIVGMAALPLCAQPPWNPVDAKGHVRQPTGHVIAGRSPRLVPNQPESSRRTARLEQHIAGQPGQGRQLDERPFAPPPAAARGDDWIAATRPLPPIPADYQPWWQAMALRPLRQSPDLFAVDVNSLIVDALRHSSRVRAIGDNAVIAETSITQADAEFDVHAFMESKFVRTSLPTGNQLEAGVGVPRLREEDWFYDAGLRRKNLHGGRFEVAQRFGTRDSNSNFFFPENQGNARLTLSYNQPLLNGAGKAYNSSLIVLANLDTQITVDRTAAELQDHLLEVTEGLWRLYQERCVLLQKQRHLERAELILKRLVSRREVDSLDSQIARARAAVAMRRSELIRAATGIRNAESRLRALVNSPQLLANRTAELVPTQPPARNSVLLSMQDAQLSALENRPEIDAAAREIEAARVRLDIAKNELLPVLDIVLESYVSGLRGEYNVGRSWTDQFSTGEPSYTAGFVFEVPLSRRAAKAQHRRRMLELRQLSSRFQAAMETLNSEVEVAVREVETAYQEMEAKYQAMVAAEADANYLQRRWEILPGEDRAASFVLEDLLDAQDRLAITEYGFVLSQVDYTVSQTRLHRATGTLLKYERVEVLRAQVDCLPTSIFEKSGEPRENLPPPTTQRDANLHD